MRIYTRTGDRGETGLAAGQRVPKDHPRVEACGTVDELNAALGMVRADSIPDEIDQLLGTIQNDLFAVGAELALPTSGCGAPNISADHSARLEQHIDRLEGQLPALNEFILPSGSTAASATHLARAICRRAERRIVTLSGNSQEIVPEAIIVYLNRLSDLLFILARTLNQAAGQAESRWKKHDR